LYWKTASRQHRNNGALAVGSYNEGWTSDYYSYLSGWLKSANLAVSVADEKIATGVAFPYTENLKHVSRIWRVYLMSEFTDNFGPMPVDAFSGVNPEFSSVQDVYYFMLSELKDATEKLDVSVVNPSELAKYDQAYGFDWLKWKKYGNSMRLRLAMRLSEVDASKAKAEFEDAASKELLTSAGDIFKVQERSGWDALSGVMSREWNAQPLSATLNNLYVGLGGVKSEDQLDSKFHEKIKPSDYIGLKWDQHLTSMTNDPSAGYWLDGLPEIIDPRAYKAFIIPGDFENPSFSFYPSWTNDARTVVRNLVDDNGNVQVAFDGTYTWNAASLGNWGTKSAKNQVSFYTGTIPRLSQRFRASSSQRIFFADWETYFLLAEGAIRGWNTPMSAKAAYESGIRASFNYWGVDEFADAYIQSEAYNRVGTSVKWDHITEPPASVTMKYMNGYTNEPGTMTYTYPVNHLYKNGSVKNDLLTKVITQKYIAQLPWAPMEAWSDHRRLGLPFFDNPAVDLPLTDLPNLSQANYMTANVKNFPQRLKYPSGLANSNPAGYEQAVQFLGGPDAVLTPLWWAKK
ncbi:MAG TPA: SusD/RagB family nutrient-binding outer membrane lipoprotein, partial [Prolixibacteraceae bacterium]|nr:SusD/RagB family nutrient-binding outer membrane lipoprotein [Prolixibacteraceae bacterium]